VAAAICFRLAFGPSVASEPIVVQPEGKKRPRASIVPGIVKPPADEVKLVFQDDEGRTLVGSKHIVTELATLLELPSAEVVAGELEDDKIDVALLDRKVSSTLLAAKYATSFETLQRSLQDIAKKNLDQAKVNFVNTHQEAMAAQSLQGELAPPLQELAAARARAEKNEAELQTVSKDPGKNGEYLAHTLGKLRQLLVNPAAHGDGLLRHCLIARAARGEIIDVGVELEEHLVVADLVSPDDAAEKLLTLRS
jgi:hypothetical protein